MSSQKVGRYVCVFLLGSFYWNTDIYTSYVSTSFGHPLYYKYYRGVIFVVILFCRIKKERSHIQKMWGSLIQALIGSSSNQSLI